MSQMDINMNVKFHALERRIKMSEAIVLEMTSSSPPPPPPPYYSVPWREDTVRIMLNRLKQIIILVLLLMGFFMTTIFIAKIETLRNNSNVQRMFNATTNHLLSQLILMTTRSGEVEKLSPHRL